MDSWTIKAVLEWTTRSFEERGIPDARVDAEHLLAHTLGVQRIALYTEYARPLSEGERAAFRDRVRRRFDREPVAYIEGERGFHALDLTLTVDKRVLIPRPETEHLVDWLLESLRPPPAPIQRVLDVGTGSGAIALAVKRARADDVQVMGVDVDEGALAVAKQNAERLEIDVTFSQSDLLSDAPAGEFHAIAANLPYVPSADIGSLMPEVRDHEPRLALDGGSDGFDLIRRLIDTAPQRLVAGGGLFLEVGIDQAHTTAKLLEDGGFVEVSWRDDYGGIPRIVAGFTRLR